MVHQIQARCGQWTGGLKALSPFPESDTSLMAYLLGLSSIISVCLTFCVLRDFSTLGSPNRRRMVAKPSAVLPKGMNRGRKLALQLGKIVTQFGICVAVIYRMLICERKPQRLNTLNSSWCYAVLGARLNIATLPFG